MALTTAAGEDLLKLLFENVSWANVGDAGGLLKSVADGVWYLSLMTGAPGVGGTQLTNETTYTGYVRLSVARGIAEWTVTGLSVSNDNAQTFVTPTGGSGTITHLGVGTDSSGAGNLVLFGTLVTPLVIAIGTPPKIGATLLSLVAS